MDTVDLKKEYDSLLDDSVVITLLSTLKCNFKCGHCMFESGPDAPSGWMEQPVLDDIENQIVRLSELGAHVSLNLIGGEPTMIDSRFRHYLSWMQRMHDEYGCSIEMTTNGWWLEKVDTTKRVLGAIGDCITDFGMDGNGFTVRVSNDRYHDPYRKGYDPVTRLAEVFDESLEGPYCNSWYACFGCREEIEEGVDTCPLCGSDNVGYDFEMEEVPVPVPDKDMPWIYVEKKSVTQIVIPTGRAKSIIGVVYDPGSSLYGSCAHNVLTYKPDGILSDVCCRGSDFPVGTAKNDPIQLLLMARAFNVESPSSCRNCARASADWIRDDSSFWWNVISEFILEEAPTELEFCSEQIINSPKPAVGVSKVVFHDIKVAA